MRAIILTCTLLLLFGSCKKNKVKRFKIGEEKGMIITNIDQSITTVYSGNTAVLPYLNIDIDQNGESDLLFSTGFFSDFTFDANESPKTPWKLLMEVKSDLYSFYKIPGSNVTTNVNSTYYGGIVDGNPRLIEESKYSCNTKEGEQDLGEIYRLKTASHGDSFDSSIDEIPSAAEFKLYDIAVSKHSVIKKEFDHGVILGDTSYVSIIVVERGCDLLLNQNELIYFPFQKKEENGIRLGWIEMTLTEEALHITRSAISESLIKE